MGFKVSTLNKCNRIAAKVSPSRYLSLDGPKVQEIIRLLLPESQGQPGSVCAQLRQIGKANRWDMPRMKPGEEEGFLRWLVVETAKTVPVS
jgi:phage FluMu protein Com